MIMVIVLLMYVGSIIFGRSFFFEYSDIYYYI